MKRLLTLSLAAAACLAAGLILVLLNAYRGGIAVQLGDVAQLTPPPKRPAAPPARAYSNEQLHEHLLRQQAELGIADIVPPHAGSQAPAEGFLGPQLGGPETRSQAEAAIRQLRRLRRSVDVGKKGPVPLDGKTVPLLAEDPPSDGRALSGDSLSAAGAWSGDFGGGREGTFTISDRGEWETFWSASFPGPAPAVDFDRWRVAAVFLGYRPTGGYRVEIGARAEVGPADVTVSYREIPPAPGRTPPEGATAPYAMRLFPRSELPLRFRKSP